MRLFAFLPAFSAAFAAAVTLPGDADRGRQVFETQRCITCHSVNGQGGKSAPDLGKATARDLTPSLMAGLMWNHAPAMWAAMQKAGIERPQLTQQQAADLFAYFFSARFFERPGDAARGKQVFTSKRCAECHASGGPGKPPAEWQPFPDAIALVTQMWSHAPQMLAEFNRRKIPHPQLTSQDLTDLRVYLQNLPPTRSQPPEFSLASPQTGQELFEVKGCVGCHKGNLSLANRPGRRSLSDLAAAMWNHAGSMGKNPVTLNVTEMRRIMGYLWSLQFFDDRGDAKRGRQVFTRKNCASCHNNPSSGAPSLAGRAGRMYPFEMVQVLWQHGPAMLSRMEEKKVPWPRFSGSEMADLTAYLNQGTKLGTVSSIPNFGEQAASAPLKPVARAGRFGRQW